MFHVILFIDKTILYICVFHVKMKTFHQNKKNNKYENISFSVKKHQEYIYNRNIYSI